MSWKLNSWHQSTITEYSLQLIVLAARAATGIKVLNLGGDVSTDGFLLQWPLTAFTLEQDQVANPGLKVWLFGFRWLTTRPLTAKLQLHYRHVGPGIVSQANHRPSPTRLSAFVSEDDTGTLWMAVCSFGVTGPRPESATGSRGRDGTWGRTQGTQDKRDTGRKTQREDTTKIKQETGKPGRQRHNGLTEPDMELRG